MHYFVNVFSTELNDLRLHHSRVFCHEVQQFEQNSRRTMRTSCVLCRTKSTRRETRFYCSICRVPLCITPLGKSSPASTCFKKWHNSVNLKRESKRKQQALIKWKQGN